jgi:hypothetical protein
MVVEEEEGEGRVLQRATDAVEIEETLREVTTLVEEDKGGGRVLQRATDVELELSLREGGIGGGKEETKA